MTSKPIPTVLVVDDMKMMRTALKGILDELNYDIVGEAANGREAVDVFARERPDMVLLDINMPVMGGDEALQHVMAEDPDAIVIMLTSISDMSTVQHCLESGATSYILKDTPMDEIQDAIRETWESAIE